VGEPGAVNRPPHRGADQIRRIGLLRRRSPARLAAALAGAADPGTIALSVKARGRIRRKVARRSQNHVKRDEQREGPTGAPGAGQATRPTPQCATRAASIEEGDQFEDNALNGVL